MSTGQWAAVVIPAVVLIQLVWLTVPTLFLAAGGTAIVVTFAAGIAFDMGRGKW